MGREDHKRRDAIQRAADTLAEPARVMLGYQDLVVEHVNALGMVELAPDVDRVLIAARELNDMIDQVQTGNWSTVPRVRWRQPAADSDRRHQNHTRLLGTDLGLYRRPPTSMAPCSQYCR